MSAECRRATETRSYDTAYAGIPAFARAPLVSETKRASSPPVPNAGACGEATRVRDAATAAARRRGPRADLRSPLVTRPASHAAKGEKSPARGIGHRDPGETPGDGALTRAVRSVSG